MKSASISFAVVLFASGSASALTLSDCLPLSADEAEGSRIEHLFGGLPDHRNPVFERTGYVISYNEELQVPRWAALRTAAR